MLKSMATAHEMLARNLRELMANHDRLTNRPALAAATGLSARTIGYMLQSGKGNSTLANIELVARAFKVPVWHLLVDSPTVRKMTQIAQILDAPAVPDERTPRAFDARNHVKPAPTAAEPPAPDYLRKIRPTKPKK